MSLHVDLLQQAHRLATLDPRRPKQVNLRRAVSSAYYALFHLLTFEAARLYASDFGFQSRITRTYNHAEMKKVATFFAVGKLPKSLQPVQGSFSIRKELQNVANQFVTLQQARHEADYDLTTSYSRKDVIEQIEWTQQVFDDWNAVRKTDETRLFLACFLLWKRWDEEPRQ